MKFSDVLMVAATQAGGGTTAPPPTPTLTWTSGTSTYDPAFSLTEIIEADVVQLDIDDNSDFSSLYDSDTNTVDAAEAASGNLTFPGISTLGFATTYYARARYQRGGVWSDWSASVSKAMDAEVTPATVEWTSKLNTVNYGGAGTTYTSAALAIGAADANRIVVLSLNYYDGNGSNATSVTIGGVTATQIGSRNGNSTLWRAAVPTGTTAVVVASGANGIEYIGMHLFRVVTTTPTPTENEVLAHQFRTSFPLPGVTTPANGVAIVVSAIETTSGTPGYTNATIDTSDQSILWSHIPGHISSAGTVTVTLTGLDSNTGGMMSVSFGP